MFLKKIHFFLFCCWLSLTTQAQFKNIGNNAKHTPNDKYLISVYGYGDVIRELGGGIQYRIMPQLSLDVGFYNIRKSGRLIAQWDYYDFKGFGLSIKPKYWFYKLSCFYVCPNISYEWVSHDKAWVEYGRGDEGYLRYLQATKGKMLTVGVNFGTKINIKQFFIEPFAGFGFSEFKGYTITYDIDASHTNFVPSITLPDNTKYTNSFLQLNLGIKIGVDFIKNKQRQKVFDFVEQYTPKINALNSFFSKTSFENKNVRRAYNHYKSLNRKALKAYRKNYFNTQKIQQKMNIHFQVIEGFINQSH